MMAAGYSRRVLDTIVSLGDDGVVVCPDDQDKFAALIGDYFNEMDNDDSRSEEDLECGKYIPPKRLHSFNTCIAAEVHSVATEDIQELGNFPL